MSSVSPSPESPIADVPPPPSELGPPPPEPPSVSPPPPGPSQDPPGEPPPQVDSPPPPEPPSVSPPTAVSPPPEDNPAAPPPQINTPPPAAGTPPPQSPPAVSSPPPPLPAFPPASPALPPPPPPSLPPPPEPSTPPPTTSSPPPPDSSPPPPTLPDPPPSTNPPPNPENPSRPPPPPPRITPPSPIPIPIPPASSPPPPRPPVNSPPPTTPENSPPPPRPPSNSPPPTIPENSPPPPRPPSNSPPTTPEDSPPPPARRPPRGSSAPPPNSEKPSSSPPPSPPKSSNSPPRGTAPPLATSPPPPPVASAPPIFSPPISLVPPGDRRPNNSTNNVTLAIVLVLGFLFLGVLGTAACCFWRRKKRNTGQNGNHVLPTSIDTSPNQPGSIILKVQSSASSNQDSSTNGISHSTPESGGLGGSRSWLTYDELVAATDGFSSRNLLGQGGFGSVYKGTLVDGREIAVKKLKIGGGQGEREFRAEVEIISRIHHRHLVSLVGYCISESRRLLVYEYVPNNTLYFHLHGQGRPVMNWITRVKVAIGAARGLAYLHEDCHPRIIHRDIKSSNILLENNFVARVSDFGLAKLAMDAHSHITTRVMGTFGYLAPEYASSGKLTEKSDVYSFGVVLLELITGRKPVDMSQPLGEESLVEWARPLLSNALETQEFTGLVDPRLENSFLDSEMFRMIEAAAACVRHSATKRPKMGQLVRAFDYMAPSDLSNGMKVGESEVFNSAQQSEEIRLFQRMAFGSQDYSTDFFSQNSSSEDNQVNSPKMDKIKSQNFPTEYKSQNFPTEYHSSV